MLPRSRSHNMLKKMWSRPKWMNMGVTNRQTWPCAISGSAGPREGLVEKSVMNRPMIGWGLLPSLEKRATTTLITMSTIVTGPNP